MSGAQHSTWHTLVPPLPCPATPSRPQPARQLHHAAPHHSLSSVSRPSGLPVKQKLTSLAAMARGCLMSAHSLQGPTPCESTWEGHQRQSVGSSTTTHHPQAAQRRRFVATARGRGGGTAGSRSCPTTHHSPPHMTPSTRFLWRRQLRAKSGQCSWLSTRSCSCEGGGAEGGGITHAGVPGHVRTGRGTPEMPQTVQRVS